MEEAVKVWGKREEQEGFNVKVRFRVVFSLSFPFFLSLSLSHTLSYSHSLFLFPTFILFFSLYHLKPICFSLSHSYIYVRMSASL